MSATERDPLDRLTGTDQHSGPANVPADEPSGGPTAVPAGPVAGGATKGTRSAAPKAFAPVRAARAAVVDDGIEGHSLANSDKDLLEELTPAIEAARSFAERWENAYRSHVFRVALDRLIGLGPASPTSGGASSRRAGAQRHARLESLPSAAATAGGLGPYDKIARALDVEVDSVERALQFDEDGEIHILARIDGTAKRDLQTKYSLVYLFVKEVAFGERMVSADELRTLCIEHACYDVANFMANFSKDVTAGILRQLGERGTRGRKFMASKKGLDDAKVLLRELASQ